MIYSPGRFLFFHASRSAGRSITTTLAQTCLDRGIPFICDTTFRRHERGLGELVAGGEWRDIFKFVIYRSTEERIKSWQRLVRRDRECGVADDPLCPKQWREWLEMDDETLRWETRNFFIEEPFDYWVTRGVNVFPYETLAEDWPYIMDHCRLPYRPLVRVDQ